MPSLLWEDTLVHLITQKILTRDLVCRLPMFTASGSNDSPRGCTWWQNLPEMLLLVSGGLQTTLSFPEGLLPFLRRLQEEGPPAPLDHRGKSLALLKSHPPHSRENTASTLAPKQTQFPEGSFPRSMKLQAKETRRRKRTLKGRQLDEEIQSPASGCLLRASPVGSFYPSKSFC